MMNEDPIVQEVRKAREEIFAEEGYDLRRLGERLRREQQAHPELIVNLAHKGLSRESPKAVRGVIRGKMVELAEDPGLPDGQAVTVLLSPGNPT